MTAMLSPGNPVQPDELFQAQSQGRFARCQGDIDSLRFESLNVHGLIGRHGLRRRLGLGTQYRPPHRRESRSVSDEMYASFAASHAAPSSSRAADLLHDLSAVIPAVVRVPPMSGV